MGKLLRIKIGDEYIQCQTNETLSLDVPEVEPTVNWNMSAINNDFPSFILGKRDEIVDVYFETKSYKIKGKQFARPFVVKYIFKGIATINNIAETVPNDTPQSYTMELTGIGNPTYNSYDPI